ncbi:MAG: hypothetical protein ACR2PS_16130 [Pseudomonadales bacterium]
MLRFEDIAIGTALPGREYRPDNVQLFLYNAALWNAHRIHFDHPYATEVEGYPGLVLAGPLLGDWLHQCVEEWLGENGSLVAMHYSNRVASYVGETLRSGGTVTRCDSTSKEVEIEVFIKNEAEDVVAPGAAVVRFHNQ